MEERAVFAHIKGLTKEDFQKIAFSTFKGWHYMTPDPIPRTAFAAVASHEKTRLEEKLLELKAIDIGDSAKKEWDKKYAVLLFNKGQAIQTRAENMLLARQAIVLVRGKSPDTIATPCNAEGWIMLTNAHTLAMNQAIQFLLSEAERSQGSAEFSVSENTVWAKIRDTSGNAPLSDKGETLRREKSLESLKDLHVHPELMAHLVQATANILTAYSDAGTRFRDRQARLEAIRHQTQTARAILAYQITEEKFKELFKDTSS